MLVALELYADRPGFSKRTTLALPPGAIGDDDVEHRRSRTAVVWQGLCNASRIQRQEEIAPTIHVYGNSAVVAYYFDMGDQTVDMGSRDMFFFVNEAGRWWAGADQFSPYPV